MKISDVSFVKLLKTKTFSLKVLASRCAHTQKRQDDTAYTRQQGDLPAAFVLEQQASGLEFPQLHPQLRKNNTNQIHHSHPTFSITTHNSEIITILISLFLENVINSNKLLNTGTAYKGYKVI